MLDVITYALLRKQIASAASGISDIKSEGNELVFVLADGREVRVEIPTTGVQDAEVRDGALVLILADGQELIYAPESSPALPLSVIDGMLQITYEEVEQK